MTNEIESAHDSTHEVRIHIDEHRYESPNPSRRCTTESPGCARCEN
jgi:hypothetical protein